MTATSPPAVHDIKVFQGATWRYEIMWKYGTSPATATPVDLTGYTAAMQIRATRGDGIYERAVYDELLIELSTSNGAIILNADGTPGRIRLSLSAAQTTDIPATAARYDLELTDTATGDVVRLMMGETLISEEVTRGA